MGCFANFFDNNHIKELIWHSLSF